MAFADQLTPARNIGLGIGPSTSLASPNMGLVLIGHAASGATGVYTVITVSNVSDETAASGEISPKFGATSELTKMVLAAVRANAGGNVFPTIKVIPLASTDTAFGSSSQALTALKKTSSGNDVVAGPYDANVAVNFPALVTAAQVMSGGTRCMSGQFGTTAVGVNFSVTDPATLTIFDKQNACAIWDRDSSPTYSVGEASAAAAAAIAAGTIPFLPLNGVVVGSFPAPALEADWIQIGVGLESETALSRGWTPMKVNPNHDVAFVRTITSRISVNGDGVTPTKDYIDVQDFQVLYYWRKVIFARQSQKDFTQAKASAAKARALKSEMIRLANNFQDLEMFQAVKDLAPLFTVTRGASDRSRFDLATPVNVIPGLHVINTDVTATTQFDVLTV